MMKKLQTSKKNYRQSQDQLRTTKHYCKGRIHFGQLCSQLWVVIAILVHVIKNVFFTVLQKNYNVTSQAISGDFAALSNFITVIVIWLLGMNL